MKAHLVFEIHSYWHAGTGRGAGSALDAVVFRTLGGLPSLPGRTVKGLVREAVELGEQLGLIAQGRAVLWFGTSLDRSGAVAASKRSVRDDEQRERLLEEARFRTRPGVLRISSAVVGEDDAGAAAWEAWARATPDGASPLFRSFASTRVEENGIASDKTLRAIELVVPMRLRALVSDTRNGSSCEDWRSELRLVLPYLRALGSHRNRGLGRCEVTLS